MVIPEEVKNTLKKLEKSGFVAYIVGGCVRDLLLNKTPKDWDITTSAKPEEIIKVFPDSFYENQFGTVGVKTDSQEKSLTVIEITTFRTEEKYTDKRHPDKVKFAKTIEEDLRRRDFTINALAISLKDNSYEITDLFNGQEDLKSGLIRAVGDPDKRFNEDALRLMRAIRLSSELNFRIEELTYQAIKKNIDLIRFVAKERIRDEFIKIINSLEPMLGLEMMREVGLLQLVIPELADGYGVTQNKHHIYTVWEHNLRALNYAAKNNYPLLVKLAALFHDVAKPHTKQGEGPNSTFYGHDVVGAKMATKIMERLKFSREEIEKVSKLVRWHLFNYDPEKGITDSAVRRLIMNVGAENIEDLVKVRICDRIGSGVPKAIPYRLRHFQFRVEKILREGEAISVKMLKINGNEIMTLLNILPTPRIGHFLNILLEEVIDDSAKNNKEYLLKRVGELNNLTDEELKELREKSKTKIEFLENERETKIKGKYWVK